MRITVTAQDVENGETGVRHLEGDDYCLVVCGRLYLATVNKFGNGTVQLTLKVSKDES